VLKGMMKKKGFPSQDNPASARYAVGNRKASEPGETRSRRSFFRKTILLPVLLVVLVSCAVYSRALSNGFVYDDDAQVVENFWIRDFSFLPKLFLTDVWKFYGEGTSNYYRPIMHVVYMINYHVFGLAAWGFHLVNILFHASVSIMVFLISSKLLGTSGSHPSGSPSSRGEVGRLFTPQLIAALLFAVHPINTEAVTWIAGLPELTFAFFYLLSLYLYMGGKDDGSPSATTLLFSAASFFIAALSKETALTLPIVLLVYDSVFQKGRVLLVDRLRRYAPYLAVVGLYFAMRLNALETFAPLRRHTDLSVYQYVINVFPLFSQYLGKLLLPVNLSAYYVLHPIAALLTTRGIFSLVATAAFAGAMLLAARKSRVAFFGLALIVIPLLPVLYIPGLGENSFTERYLYVPSAGFSLLIGLGILKATQKPGRRWAVVSAFCFILCLYTVGTVLRIPVWRDDYSLWADTLPKAPDGAIPQSLMGDVFLFSGQNDRAVEQYKAALRLKPNLVIAHTNIAVVYKNMGLIDQAIQELQTAIELNPSSAVAHASLGVMYNETGMKDKALDELHSALELNPYLPGAYVSLGDVYSSQGMIDEAIRQYQEGLRINPDFAEAYNNLGIAYASKGMLDKAIRQFEAAIRLRPDDPMYHLNAAKAYKAIGRVEIAEEHLRRARQLEEGKH
jgi:tetratricopeptide (TPR) repeat protein